MVGKNISISHLSVSFGTEELESLVVHDVSTTFSHGEITGVIGESGSGKSVIAMSILKLLPDGAKISGECIYKGQNLYKMSMKDLEQIRGKEVGLIPQNPQSSLNPMMRLEVQLMEPLVQHGMAKKKEAKCRVRKLLQDFGFSSPEEIGKQYAFEMSGGMNQRIVSALGLICDPPWVIADEPTKGLDAFMRNQAYEVLKNVYEERQCGMMVITHDLLLAKRLCHKLCVTYSGEMVEQGVCEDVFTNPLHPYTQDLLLALPENGMKPIPTPTKNENNSTCKYYSRCGRGSEVCEGRVMEDFSVNHTRKVRCFLYA